VQEVQGSIPCAPTGKLSAIFLIVGEFFNPRSGVLIADRKDKGGF
jgi:hypothetical protein